MLNRTTSRFFFSVPFVFALQGVLLLTSAARAEDLFPDKGLEQAVRKEVFAKRYNAEPLTKEDVKNISQVNGKGMGIKSLEGLQFCTSIMMIDLERNELSDLTPLKDLKLLQSINFSDNKIESIEPLTELTRMQYLELSKNQIKDISPIAKMSNMRSLYLSNNQIDSLETVGGLTKVWTLYAGNNPIKDFSPISKLSWLSMLDLRSTGVVELGFLAPLTELNYVILSNNKIEDLTALVDMAAKDMAGGKRFSPFWRVYLDSNPLSEAAVKEQIPKLLELGSRVILDKPQ